MSDQAPASTAGPELPSHKRSAEDALAAQEGGDSAAKKAKTEMKATPGKDVGLVKWFDINKSFGFITRESGDDVFVHQSNIRNSKAGRKGLADGETVEFGVEIQNGKMRAMEVCAVGGGPVTGQPDPMAMQAYGGSSVQGALPPHNASQLAAGRVRGKCKWFNPAKGFGFIIPIDGSAEVFVHQSDLKSDRRQNRSIAEEENVEFTLELDGPNKKRKALDVTGPGGAFVVGQPIAPVVESYGGYGGGGGGGGYGGASYGTPVAYQQPAAYGHPAAAAAGGGSSNADQWAAYQAAYAQYAAAAAAAGTPVVPPAQAPQDIAPAAAAYPQYNQGYPPQGSYPQYGGYPQ